MRNHVQTAPSIRFRGFTEDWEQRKLSSLYEKGGTGGTPKSTNKSYYMGDIPFLGISDVSSSNGYVSDTEKHISEEGLKNSSAWIVPKEAISLAMYASVGKVAILKTDAATSQAFFNMIFKNLPTRNFVFQYLLKMESTHGWDSLVSTGTQSNLNAQKIREIEILIPNIEEQSKIGAFFKQLDTTITLQQQQLSNYKEMKTALLQKMFPKAGEKRPEVRFEGFTGEWEERKLGEYFKKYQNTIYLQDDVEYSQVTVRNTGIIEFRGTKRGALIGRKRQYLINTRVHPNTLTFTRQSIYDGGIGFVPEHLHGAIVTENMPLFSMNAEMNKNFVISMFDTSLYFKRVLEGNKPIGSAQKALHEKVWLEGELPMPNIDEQTKIGTFFKQLDDTITHHQQQLDNYKELKKAMLQNLFI